MIAGSAAFWVRALRWRMLLSTFDKTISRLTVFNAVNIGIISNYVLPRIGEFVRSSVITKHSAPADQSAPDKKKAPYDKVLGTVAFEEGWELAVMLLLLLIVTFLKLNLFSSFIVENIWYPYAQNFCKDNWKYVAVVLLGVAIFIYAGKRLQVRFSPLKKIGKIIKGIANGVASCMKMEKKWLFFVYTAYIWVLYWIMAVSAIKAVPFLEHLDLIDALFISIIGGLGFAFPVPGGIGAFHFAVSTALCSIYGINLESGLVYATISHSSQAVTHILFGTLSSVYEYVIPSE